jgi:hypothetical protein
MAQYEEQVSAVVGVQYVGQDQLARMAADFERFGGVIEGGAARIANAADLAGRGMLGIAEAHRIMLEQLNLPATQLNQLNQQFRAFERGFTPPQGLRETQSLIQGLLGDVNRLNQQGAAVPAAALGRMRAEMATLLTQQLGLQAAPARRPTVRQYPEEGGRTRLETRAGDFRLMPAPGGGYSVLYPGPQGSRQSGGQSDVFRTKADAISAVRDVLAAFGSVPRDERARALPPGVGGAPVPDAGAAAATARVNARLERYLAEQTAATARSGPATALGVGPIGAATLTQQLAPTGPVGSVGEALRRAQQIRDAREAELRATNAAAMAAVANAPRPDIPPYAAAQTALSQQLARGRMMADPAGQFAGAQASLSAALNEARLRKLGEEADFLARKMRGLGAEIDKVERATASARTQRGPSALGAAGVPFSRAPYQQIGPGMLPPGQAFTPPGVYRVTTLGGPGGQPFVSAGTGGQNWRYTSGASRDLIRPDDYYYGPLPPRAGGGGGRGGGMPPGGYGSPFGDPGEGGGWRQQFGAGFRGRSDCPYAEQLGQKFKFALFYGTAYKILFTLTQTLQTALDESVKFQQAMAELNIATGRSTEANSALAQNLGDAAAAVGMSPSEGIEIGARAIGLYDLGGATQATQEAAMRKATEAVTRMQFTTGRTPEQLQLDVGAISQAMDFGYQAIDRIADLDAYFTKRFGVRTGASLETVAQTGSLGIQAGFGPEEIFAAATKIQSRTGQTPAAVAGLLSQIFSRGGEGALTDLVSRHGIDPQASLRDQLAALSRVYNAAGISQQSQISATFGRGRSQGAAAVLLEDFEEIAAAAEQAKTQAGGVADQQFQAKMQNLGGELAQLSGAFKNFAIELANTGIIDAFGLGVVVLREFLQATTDVLRVWNEIPAIMRYAIYGITAFTLALRAGATSALARGILNVRGVPAAVQNPNPTVRGALAGAGVRGGAGVLARTGAGLLGGPVGIGVIAAFSAIAAGKDTWDSINSAARQATDTMLGIASIDFNDAGQLRGAADQLTEASRRRRDLNWGADVASAFGAPWQSDANAASDLLQRRAERLRARADREEAEATERQANIRRSATPFGDLSQGAIEAGFTQLEEAGVSAATQLRMFNDALLSTGDAAREAMEKQFDLGVFVGETADDFINKLMEKTPEKGFAYTTQDVSYGRVEGGEVVDVGRLYKAGDINRRLSDRYDPDELERRLRESAEASGITSGALTTDQLGAQTDTIRNYVMGLLDPPLEAVPEVAAWVSEFARKYMEEKTAAERRAADPNTIYSPEEIMDFLAFDLPAQQKRQSQQLRGDTGGQLRAARQTLQERLNRADSGAEFIEDLQHQIDEAYADVAELAIKRMQTNLRLAARNAPNLRSAVAQAGTLRTQMIREAVTGRNPEALAQLIEQGGQAEAEIARQEIERWYKGAKAAAASGEVVDNIRRQALASALAATGGGDTMSESRQTEVDRQVQGAVDAYLKDVYGDLDETRRALLGGVREGLAAGPSPQSIAAAQAGAALRPGDTVGAARVAMQEAAANLRDAVGGNALDFAKAQRAFNESQAAYAAAQVDASKQANSNRAARIGGDLGNARAELQNARLELQKYAKGTQEYNAALGQLYTAQNAMADAVREAQANRRLLAGDITDPVYEAAVEADRAAAKYKADRKRFAPGGINRDEQAQLDVDQLDARRARAAEEQAAFQQKFNDMQVAESLGQISHAAYIQYLQNEHDRLEKIKNKTRQQIEQQQQIDQALKAATDAMTGQFNLGDIKLPTPYEVRRYIQSTTGAQLVGAQTATGPTTNVYIDGTDIGAVMTVVREALGAGVTTYTTAPKKA